MKLVSAILFLAGLTAVSASGEAIPWVEDFAGLADGDVEDTGSTSWTAVRNSGTFEIKNGALWVNGGGDEGELDSGDIDVSDVDGVEITTTIYSDGDLESSGQWVDYIKVFAHLDDGTQILVGEKVAEASSGTKITDFVNVTGINTLNVEIIAKVTAGSEHYYIQGISVLPTMGSAIDVSDVDLVEVTATVFGLGETANSPDPEVEAFAHLDNGRRVFLGEKTAQIGSGTEITNIVDVTGINMLNVQIIDKDETNQEHYYLQDISVVYMGAGIDGCTYYDLNMDSLAEGTYVSDQFSTTHGVNLTCSCNSCGSGNGKGDCRVFDTANPVGDPDLGAPNEDFGGPGIGNGGKQGNKGENSVPLGHILIVDENGADSVPDDAVGGDITFMFTRPVEMVSIDQLDNEGSEHYAMEFYRDGSLVTTVHGAYTGDNGYASTTLLGADTKNVTEMKLVLSGSGSVNSVKYRICYPFDDPNKQGGGGGDPHIKRWNRKSFDFHGECDLVLIHSDHVNGNKKLDVHIRTVIREWWSQIESAAMRIGDVTLQMDVDKFFVNGKEHSDADLPIQTTEFLIAPPVVGNHATMALRGTALKDVLKTYVVTFNDKSVVTFKVLNGFMNVVVSGHREDFEHSNGLMGTYQHGKAYGRAGTKIPDLQDFAMDWQVDPRLDPVLFTEAKGPQLPAEKCRMPDPAAKSRRRRLKVDDKLYGAAAAACADKGDETEPCMEDVFATGDLSMALLH